MEEEKDSLISIVDPLSSTADPTIIRGFRGATQAETFDSGAGMEGRASCPDWSTSGALGGAIIDRCGRPIGQR